MATVTSGDAKCERGESVEQGTWILSGQAVADAGGVEGGGGDDENGHEPHEAP